MTKPTQNTLASNINITVESHFVTELTDNGKPLYVFSYTVTIDNQNTQAVKLNSRYWLITDGEGKEIEVSGDGVIGKKPIIGANEQYQYSSGCHLLTPFGTMQGHYLMSASTEHSFEAAIPLFQLAQPYCVN